MTASFRADLGQGVNAALLDVLTLSRCIERDPTDLSAALRQYEDTRAAESAALVRIMQVLCQCYHMPAGSELQLPPQVSQSLQYMAEISWKLPFLLSLLVIRA